MSNDIQRAVGRLEGKVDQVLEQQKKTGQDMELVKLEQKRASRQREEQAERLKEVEKNTADFNKWKERGVGALMLISGIAALVGGTLATSWHKILDVLRGW